MRTNKLRTSLTAFSIAWGIFLLIVLLGSGYGFENGIKASASQMGMSSRAMKVELSTTNRAYAGYQAYRQLQLSEKQFEYLQNSYKNQTEALVKMKNYVYDFRPRILSNKGEVSGQVISLSSFEQKQNKISLTSGRFFLEDEIKNGERVILISSNDEKKLFPKSENALGQLVLIWGSAFKVVGVLHENDFESSKYYIPYNTYRNLFPNAFTHVTSFYIYPKESLNNAEIKQLGQSIQSDIKRLLKVHPDDRWAVYLDNPREEERSMAKVFQGIRLFLWIVGLSTLTIGIISVSNIMQVTVRERLKEIGIRKALGAKPRNIMALVMGEGTFLSVSSGIIGILFGMGFLKILSLLTDKYGLGAQMIPSIRGEISFHIFKNPEIHLSTAIYALVVLIIAGLIAGYGPAQKAIKVPAVIAMRDIK